jgi:hypothetical protein
MKRVLLKFRSISDDDGDVKKAKLSEDKGNLHEV